MKYQKKPVVIEAITFDELVAHGVASGGNVVNGMPWSFEYKWHPITHENDDCYLIPTLEGTMRFNRGDMLITGVKGEIYPCKADIFAATYHAVSETEPPNVPILKHFRYEHLPEKLQVVSKPFGDLARQLASTIPVGAELVAGLRKLLEAKDCAVRAALEDVPLKPTTVHQNITVHVNSEAEPGRIAREVAERMTELAKGAGA